MPDEAAWRRLLERALDGRPFETLITHTFEDLEIRPLYPRATTRAPRAFRQKPGSWQITQRVDHPDPATANSIARIDLSGGADTLTLCIASAPASRGFGIEIHSLADLDAALEAIDLDRVPLRVEAGCRSPEIARHLQSIAQARRLTSAALEIDCGHDPIGCFARTGVLPARLEALGHDAVALSKALRDSGFTGHLFLADGRPYHEAGAGEAQELACVLATAVAYLRLLEASGLGLEEARDEIAFLLPADASEFLSIAKFRALRRLWASVETHCGLEPKPIRLHAETSFRMMTRTDPRMNILRATMAAFSAAIGGADTICILPYISALGLPDEAARRLACNTQLVLIHEAHLAKVEDPAAGSGAFEALTEELCARSWTLFQRLEQQGGMLTSLEAGLPQALIAETAAARRTALARRSLEITGTSAFPDLSEAVVHAPEPTSASTVEEAAPLAMTCPPLPSQRDSEPFEALRATSDQILARTGQRPRILIVPLGAGASMATRMKFAQDLFSLAGMTAIPHSGSQSPGEVAAALHQSGCRIACLCTSETTPYTAVVATIDALRAAEAATLYLVGSAPRGAAEAVEIINPGCDVLSLLRNALVHAA